ncbi:MAG: flagellar basal-body MS-ring/collar protein FliF [Rickettsiaceae bacterium]|nr:flagellar basal-body MS-ring/collar protein FliF [Rickettsiaceae bacterium]
MSIALQIFKEIGTTRYLLLIGSIVASLIIIGLLIYNSSSSEMSILYSNLDLEDSNKIVTDLESKGIPYQIINNGTAIKVPQKEVLRLRMSMAEEGLPGKGSLIGYEIFDKEESLGSTSFLQNVKMLRALEGELTRTIETIDQVDKARLHLVIPRKELFSKERQEPRASLVLKLKSSRTLKKQEVDAISHLIASSVPELNVENITIIDTKGRSLKIGNRDDEGGGGFFGAQNDERKSAYENKYKRTIIDLLENTLGAGKVKAEVNLEMNFDRIVSNSEVFDPDGAVLRSQQTSEAKEKSSSGGETNTDVSVANNLPGGGAVSSESESAGSATSSTMEDTKNFEISKTITNQIRDSGAITRIHVAVMIDGTYTQDSSTGVDTYHPRTDEELEKIENLIKVAVGFDATRQDQVKVINMQFAKEPANIDDDSIKEWLKDELPAIIQTFVIAVVILGVFVTVIKPIAMKAFDIKSIAQDTDIVDVVSTEAAKVAPEPQDDTMLKILKTTAANNLSVNKINDIASGSSTEVVSVLKRWLNEES